VVVHTDLKRLCRQEVKGCLCRKPSLAEATGNDGNVPALVIHAVHGGVERMTGSDVATRAPERLKSRRHLQFRRRGVRGMRLLYVPNSANPLAPKPT
jgi:hypothetical protein